MANDYWVARKHINTINNLVSFIRSYIPKAGERCRAVVDGPQPAFYIVHIVQP